MNNYSHEGHIVRHLELLSRIHSREKIHDLLRYSGIRIEGNHAFMISGMGIRDADCADYILAVEALFGSSTASFARANFALAGCPCLKEDF
jgi:hypothetical protein